MTDQDLNAEQRAMVEMWERHMAAEFKTKNIDATMATMTSDPYRQSCTCNDGWRRL